MKTWLIEPRDPVIFRDGKPFSSIPGARAKSLPFPFPSTIIGAARTRAGRTPSGQFDKGKIDVLLGNRLQGPLLVEMDKNGGVNDWLFPVPADALVLRQEPHHDNVGRLVPLTVLRPPAGVETNLTKLLPVGPVGREKGKPHTHAPSFWRRSAFEAWLLRPCAEVNFRFNDSASHGPMRESRTHVSIAADKQTAEDGALFQTAGLEFIAAANHRRQDERPQLHTASRLALAIQTDADLTAGLDFLGGERRIVRWSEMDDGLPECPPELRARIREDRHCRLVLLTPGCFASGHLPSFVDPTRFGNVRISVAAAAVNRYKTVSGWDHAYVGPDRRSGRPKPTRRLVPTGSVYFLKLDGDIDSFIDAVWMRNISDDLQDQRDGFGLAVLGVWDGVPQKREGSMK